MSVGQFTFAGWMDTVEVIGNLSSPFSLSFSLVLSLLFPLTFEFTVPSPFKLPDSLFLTFVQPFSFSFSFPFSVPFPGPISFSFVVRFRLEITTSCIPRMAYWRMSPHMCRPSQYWHRRPGTFTKNVRCLPVSRVRAIRM